MKMIFLKLMIFKNIFLLKMFVHFVVLNMLNVILHLLKPKWLTEVAVIALWSAFLNAFIFILAVLIIDKYLAWKFQRIVLFVMYSNKILMVRKMTLLGMYLMTSVKKFMNIIKLFLRKMILQIFLWLLDKAK